MRRRANAKSPSAENHSPRTGFRLNLYRIGYITLACLLATRLFHSTKGIVVKVVNRPYLLKAYVTSIFLYYCCSNQFFMPSTSVWFSSALWVETRT